MTPKKSSRKSIDRAKWRDFAHVSYSGDIYTRAEVAALWKHLERYRSWVLLVLGS